MVSKKKTFLLSSAAVLALLMSVSCSQNPEVRTARELASRIIPEHASQLRFEQTADTSDVFELETVRGRLVIRGNNSNSMAVGLNYYLKNYCLTTVSWFLADPVEMPEVLPLPEEKLRVESFLPERFFINYCTYGYTMPWWGWAEWERFIDWMALNGVTMPLNISGQEATMMKVWESFGIDPDAIRASFTGPCFLPWNRLMDIDGWKGPLPQKWIDAQEALQKRILEREKQLGMTPILPAFNGHVPAALVEKFPEAHVKSVTKWDGFEPEYGCWFLDPADPLFARIQKVFLEEQEKLYGTSHIYGLDIFNEVHFFEDVEGDNWPPELVAKISKHVYETLVEADPEAVWMQVSWPLYHDAKHWPSQNVKAYLDAVPKGKMVMIDYFCDEAEVYAMNDNFYGQPYFFCFLGNFGGNTNLSGDFHQLSEKLDRVLADGGENLLGLGGTPEGLGVSQFLFEYVFDRAWNAPVSDEQWVKTLAARRAGRYDENIENAWKMLTSDIYTGGATYSGLSSVATIHPCFEGHWNWTTPTDVPYNYEQISKVWAALLSSPSDRDTYKFDIVNIGSEVIKLAFAPHRDRYTACYKAGDTDGMAAEVEAMRELFRDWNRLLACHRTFSLENWISQARSWGESDEEKDYYENCARLIITSWGGTGQLTDYANRQWSTLVDSYYRQRWEMFWEDCSDLNFDSSEFDRKVREFELRWGESDYELNFPEAGDAVEVAGEIAAKLGII